MKKSQEIFEFSLFCGIMGFGAFILYFGFTVLTAVITAII
jgi:hypothetical protein